MLAERTFAIQKRERLLTLRLFTQKMTHGLQVVDVIAHDFDRPICVLLHTMGSACISNRTGKWLKNPNLNNVCSKLHSRTTPLRT